MRHGKNVSEPCVAGARVVGKFPKRASWGVLACVGSMAATVPLSLPADDFPEGCVSCHVVLGDGMDKRLAAVLEAVGHPPLREKVAQVPADCMACHKSISDPSFMSLIHLAHFSKPETNVFIGRFSGDCRHCHAMNDSTGVASLKSGKRNW
jgi:nitrate/TMAO reductase-like tetraheme cytochrome c subunit